MSHHSPWKFLRHACAPTLVTTLIGATGCSGDPTEPLEAENRNRPASNESAPLAAPTPGTRQPEAPAGSPNSPAPIAEGEAAATIPIPGASTAVSSTDEEPNSVLPTVEPVADEEPNSVLPTVEPVNSEPESTISESEPVTESWPALNPGIVSCMVHAASAAYLDNSQVPPILCEPELLTPFRFNQEQANDVLKVFVRNTDTTAGSGVEVVLAFAGTRQDAGDVARDIQSQVLAGYNNHYQNERPDAPVLTGNERVSSGFDIRWRNQAPLARAAVNRARALTASDNITVHVVGHSLGAVTATRAAFDIARSERGARVLVWSFNSPHVGNVPFARAYAEALTPCTKDDTACLNLYQFTRTGDLVHGLPLRAHHPVWNTSAEVASRQNAGTPSEIELHACAHYHAPRASLLQPVANHDLERWISDIENMPPGHLECMLQ